MAIRRVLFVSHGCYLDDSNGAAVASRALMELLRRHGFAVEVLSGVMLDSNRDVDMNTWLVGRRCSFAPELEGSDIDAGGRRVPIPPHFRLTHRGVPITLHRGSTTKLHDADDRERVEFLQLFDLTMTRFPADVVVCYGGNRLANEVRALARSRGAATLFPLHNFLYTHAQPFADVDEILVPSQFAADHYRRTLGLRCRVLPNPVDLERVRAERSNLRYVTFVNPSMEKGVFAFARIALELGRRRPDIPLLVVEARGTEATLASCGLDLRPFGNVNFMRQTHDPRKFWGVTHVCLMPSLCWENQPLVAVEAMINGVPVIASDRGGLPETLGRAGSVLTLPDRLTPTARELPTAEEVARWVEAVVRLWDDSPFHAEQSDRSLTEAERWSPDRLEPRYVQLLEEIRCRFISNAGGDTSDSPDRPNWSYDLNV